MHDVIELFTSTLRQADQNITAARLQVFRALLTEEPLTMAELTRKLTGKTDRATIYRTIALFEKLGIVERLQIGWKYKLELSELYSSHHHHITCSNCGISLPIVEHDSLEASINDLAYSAGFTPITHQLEIRGLCSLCQASHQPAKVML